MTAKTAAFDSHKTTDSSGRSRTVPPSPASATAEGVAPVQTAIGNRGVQDLLRRRQLQAKLRVGSTGDTFEEEAERVATQVSSSSAKCHCAGTCSSCQEDKVGLVQRAARPGATSREASLPDQFVTRLGAGDPLASGARAEMEARFGRDFSAVRVHSDNQAAAVARSIGARAFTAGQEIAFDRGEYRPETPDGRRLLAHELTHVTQQEGWVPTVQRDTGSAGSNPHG